MCALQLDARNSFESAIDAQEELERVLGESDYLAAPATLESFLERYRAAAALVEPVATPSRRPGRSSPGSRVRSRRDPEPDRRQPAADQPTGRPSVERQAGIIQTRPRADARSRCRRRRRGRRPRRFACPWPTARQRRQLRGRADAGPDRQRRRMPTPRRRRCRRCAQRHDDTIAAAAYSSSRSEPRRSRAHAPAPPFTASPHRPPRPNR